MVVRGRWANPMCLLVCRRTGLVVFKIAPVIRLDSALWRVMGRLLQKSGRQKSKALLSAPPKDQRHPSVELSRRTAGCERGHVPTQVATRLHETQDSLLRIQ